MIRLAIASTGLRRRVCLTLAMLAVAFKILIPPGYMAGPSAHDLPFALVICTAQGSVAVAPSDPPPEPDEAHDAPCLFAGQGLGALAPSAVDGADSRVVAHPYRPQGAVADLAPGRGLTAPPPPARGPPSLLI